ncbi:MAG: sulfotransferase domain-containing protein [archaeon]
MPAHNAHRPVRFIILTRARTGSRMLIDLLKSHSDTQMFYELFNLDSIPREEMMEAVDDPAKYLERRLYCDYPENIKAVGFKIFYYQASLQAVYPNSPDHLAISETTPELRAKIMDLHDYLREHRKGLSGFEKDFSKVWKRLVEDKELRVIHLKRRNILETFLSLKRAFMLNKWHSAKDEPPTSQPAVKLGYDECLHAFTQTTKWEKEYDELFKSHPKLELFYENICDDLDPETRRVLDFLGLEHQKLTTPMRKQNNQKLSEAISNYWELKEQFKGTPWIKFFED